jgi:tellurite resistance protein TerC
LRRVGRMRSREALIRSGIWVGLAAVFAAVIFFFFQEGRQLSLEFVTGYLLELSLSVDNLFIFLLIFQYFAVPEEHQHRVLTWGVLGAMAMRAIFIMVGVGLIQRFHSIFYALGVLLIYSGIRLGFSGNRKVDPSRNPVVKLLRKFLPVTDSYVGENFLVRNWQGRPGLYATPLLIVLAVIETTDLLFAVDSIPAVLSITLNAFIVYAANVFAIMGLRSMFFAVAGLMRTFRFLHLGLAIILMLVGAKMIAAAYFKVPTLAMLGGIAGVLLASIVTSMVLPRRAKG